eukprot:TRINITY_DN11793_c0_g1_i1.p1 TRINITY_DN11793_c0_g1~~TRINITY_DN11793_c0_g1_i1.p1  ORF type:complete len:200 (-),score=32.50 TRINITY_DN11793_c0_g1_i1:95-694(-)
MLKLAFILLSVLFHTYAFFFEVVPHEDVCWLQYAKPNTFVGGDYQVIRGGALDIDVIVYSPDGKVISTSVRETEAKFGFNAEMEGRYRVCFSNRMSTLTTKTVSLELSADDLVKDDDAFAKEEQLDPLVHLSRQIVDSLASLQTEQKHSRNRDIAHQNTNELTNSRVLWWSIFEALTLIGASLFQVYYLRRYFEDKRTV